MTVALRVVLLLGLPIAYGYVMRVWPYPMVGWAFGLLHGIVIGFVLIVPFARSELKRELKWARDDAETFRQMYMNSRHHA